MSEAIFVEGLTKTYARKTVVDHLDLSVKSGNLPRTWRRFAVLCRGTRTHQS